ncbi:hypothetical protein [Oceanobacillus salinisoli]|uniref:hypothetical protein n=1 Tax=Oceanobacillus salinisoli TaxID=2678611 RepID=UPI0018CC3FDF|nr:hypothetical protein [Oceanobacillus salinisoli]
MKRPVKHLYPVKNDQNILPVESNDTKSIIRESGNSDVDVKVDVDTTPIAYAMLCSLLATKQISSREFEEAVRKFDELMVRNQEDKYGSIEKQYHERKPRRRF